MLKRARITSTLDILDEMHQSLTISAFKHWMKSIWKWKHEFEAPCNSRLLMLNRMAGKRTRAVVYFTIRSKSGDVFSSFSPFSTFSLIFSHVFLEFQTLVLHRCFWLQLIETPRTLLHVHGASLPSSQPNILSSNSHSLSFSLREMNFHALVPLYSSISILLHVYYVQSRYNTVLLIIIQSSNSDGCFTYSRMVLTRKCLFTSFRLLSAVYSNVYSISSCLL